MVTLVPSQCEQMLKLVFAEWVHLAFEALIQII